MSVLGLGLALFATAPADIERIPGKHLAKAPTIDGTVNDDEWAGAAKAEGMVDRDTGAVCPESATFWVGYDEKYIYFAARLGDSSPDQIKATEYRTNVSLSGDDNVSISIDLTGSTSDFNIFQINPKGATNVTLAGGRAAKREWVGDFMARGRVTDKGWEGEARIPWQVLHLPKAGPHDCRINFGRFQTRTQRHFLHTFVTSSSSALTPFWASVQIPNQEVIRTVKLLPYIYAGWDPKTGHVLNSGLDLKTQLTDQIELVGTVNPDFRNIENQILSLDFSRFERLANETRPFFQEGSDYISSGIFTSQRIDNFDVGLNTYGRLTPKTSFGIIDTIDWDRNNVLGNQETRGRRNNLSATFTHDVDPTMQVRVAYAGVDRPDLKNDASLLRISKTMGDFNLQVRDLRSKDSLEGYGSLNDAYLYYNRNGWSNYVGYATSSPHYNPRLAFVPDRDYKGVEYGAQFNRNFDKGVLNDWGFFVGGNSYRHVNDDPYRHNLTFNPFTTIRNGPALVLFASFDGFESSHDELYDVNVSYPRGNPYRNFGIDYAWGHQADHPYQSTSVSTAYRTMGRLQTNFRFQRVKLFDTQDQLIVTANYDLGQDRSISGRLVNNGHDTNFYVALRRGGNLGTEYFLILGDPNAEKFRASLILKVTMPFEIPLSKAKPAGKTVISSSPI